MSDAALLSDSFVITGYQNEARPAGDLLVTPTGGTQGTLADLLGANFGGPFLKLAGGVMNGPLTLAGDPTTDLEAATKFYVDETVAELASISVVTGEYTVSSSVAPADPGAGNLAFNSVPQADATELFISGTSANGINFQSFWTKLVPGFKLSIQESGGAAQATWVIGGAPVDHITWVSIPVTPLGGAGFPLPNTTPILVTSFGAVGGPFLPLSGGIVTGPVTFNVPTKTNVTGGNPVVILEGSSPVAAIPLVTNAMLQVERQTGASAQEAFVTYGSGSDITLLRANGTPGAPSALLNGQVIYSIRSAGYGATAWGTQVRTSFQAIADENWTDTAQGAGFVWLTQANGTVGNPPPRMKLTNAGQLFITPGGVFTIPTNAALLMIGAGNMNIGMRIASTNGGPPSYIAARGVDPFQPIGFTPTHWPGVLVTSAGDRPSIMADGYNTAPRFISRRSIGTPASPSGQGVNVDFGAWDGYAWIGPAGTGAYPATPVASVRMFSAQAFNVIGQSGSGIDFNVTQMSGTTAQLAMTLVGTPAGSFGHVLIGKAFGADTAGQLLQVAGLAQADSQQIGSSAAGQNFFTLSGAAAGSTPSIVLGGSDTNIDLRVAAKGTGVVVIDPAGGALNPPYGAGAVMRLYPQGAVTNRFEMVGVGGNPNAITGYGAGGTRPAPTAVPLNNNFLNLQGFGFDGSAWTSNLQIGFALRSAELWTTVARGTYFNWQGTPIGSTTAQDWMRMQNGQLRIGQVGTDTGQLLQVAGSARIGTSTGNYISLNEATAGNTPSLVLTGPDANIDYRIQPKAAGQLIVDSVGTTITLTGFPVGNRLLVASPDGEASRIVALSYGQSAQFAGARAQGTRAAPATLTANIPMVLFQGFGYDGTTWLSSASGVMRIEASEAWTNTAHGTRFVWLATANTTTTTNEKMRLENSGNLLIGTTVDDGTSRLQVNGQTTALIANATQAMQVGGNTVAASVNLALNTAAGQNRVLRYQTAGVSRWLVFANNSAESGANAGSDFVIQRSDDGGVSLGSPLTISRASGLITLANDLRVNGQIGFFNTAPGAKPTVSGSRGGNAALASLLTGLVGLGLVTDSSTP